MILKQYKTRTLVEELRKRGLDVIPAGLPFESRRFRPKRKSLNSFTK